MPPPVVAVGGVLVERTAGIDRVLLIQRGKAPNIGRWTFAGGRVEENERLADALVREMKEETGLDVEVGELIEVAEIIQPPHHAVVLDYIVKRLGGELRAGDDALAAELVPLTDLAARGCTPLVISIVERARARLT